MRVNIRTKYCQNPSKPSSYLRTARFNFRKFYFLLLSFVWSQNKQRLFFYAALTDWCLVAFAKWRKATVSFVLSVRPDFTVHRNTFLVTKTNRCIEFQFYWYYYSTCSGRPFFPSSGVLSHILALVHFLQLW